VSEVVVQAAAQPDYVPSIITGAVAIVAGLGGVTLTGIFNRKTAKATLKAAREDAETRWKQQTEREHEVWMRDSKKDTYARFIAATVEVTSGKHGSTTIRDAASAVSIILGEVQIVGSSDFVRLAIDANEHVVAIQELTLAAPKLQAEPDANKARIKEIHEALDETTTQLNNHILALTVLAREDLGISYD
jgi:hypothetical protein